MHVESTVYAVFFFRSLSLSAWMPLKKNTAFGLLVLRNINQMHNLVWVNGIFTSKLMIFKSNEMEFFVCDHRRFVLYLCFFRNHLNGNIWIGLSVFKMWDAAIRDFLNIDCVRWYGSCREWWCAHPWHEKPILIDAKSSSCMNWWCDVLGFVRYPFGAASTFLWSFFRFIFWLN